MPKSGEIWLDHDFFDGITPKRKYMLIMAVEQGDITYRLLTSQQHGRPEEPPCFHHDPYNGFYLGVLGAPLVKQSWLDLSLTDDMDVVAFGRMERASRLTKIMDLHPSVFCPALRCTIGAGDTTNRQAKRIGDVVAKLGCP